MGIEDLVIFLNKYGIKIKKHGETNVKNKNGIPQQGYMLENSKVGFTIQIDGETLELVTGNFNINNTEYGFRLKDLGCDTIEEVIELFKKYDKVLTLDFNTDNLKDKLTRIVGIEGIEVRHTDKGITYKGFASTKTIKYEIEEHLITIQRSNNIQEDFDTYLAYILNDGRYINETQVEDKKEELEEIQTYIKRDGLREQTLESILEKVIESDEDYYYAESVETILDRVFGVSKLPEEFEQEIIEESPKDLATKLRKRLKKEYPKTKFKITSTYSGGSMVNISWEGVPIKEVVREFIKPYRATKYDGKGYVDPEDNKVYSGVQYLTENHDNGDNLNELYSYLLETKQLSMGGLTYSEYKDYFRDSEWVYRVGLREEERLLTLKTNEELLTILEERKELFRTKFNIWFNNHIKHFLNIKEEEIPKLPDNVIDLTSKVGAYTVKIGVEGEDIAKLEERINSQPFFRAYKLRIQLTDKNETNKVRNSMPNMFKSYNSDGQDNRRVERFIKLLEEDSIEYIVSNSPNKPVNIKVNLGKVRLSMNPMYVITIDGKTILYYKNREGDSNERLRRRVMEYAKSIKLDNEDLFKLVSLIKIYEQSNDLRKKA